MSFKRYIKRGGKLYGPYVYTTKRVNGKVVSEYVKEKSHLKSSLFIGFGILAFLTLIFAGIYYFSQPTGRVTLQISEDNSGILNGSLNLLLKEGELIPADSLVRISFNSQNIEIPLSSLISANLSEGNFYVDNFNLSGSGQGFGFIGQKKVSADVFFTLLLFNEANETVANETILSNQTIDIANETTSINEIISLESPIYETTETSTNQTSEIPAEEALIPRQMLSEPVGAEITGAVIGLEENVSRVSGSISEGRPFEYSLNGQKVRIEPGSVYSESENLSEDVLNLVEEGDRVVITTNYSSGEVGFGNEFLGLDHPISISLSQFNLSGNGTLSVDLVYNNLSFAHISREIAGNITNTANINGTANQSFAIIKDIGVLRIVKGGNYTIDAGQYFSGVDYYYINNVKNITFDFSLNELTIVPDTNFTGKRMANLTAYYQNISLSQNFVIDVYDTSGTTTRQYKAVVGKPVKWVKTLNISNETGVSLELPKTAENITVKTGDEALQAVVDADNSDKQVSEEPRQNLITGNVIYSEENNGIITRILRFFRFGLTGNVIDSTSVNNIIEETSDSKIVNVSDIVDSGAVAVEYYTQAPEINESNVDDGKEITIYAPSELNYTDILAYTLLDNVVSMDSSELKLYWNASYEDAVTYGYVVENEIIPEENLTENISDVLITGNVVLDVESGIGVSATTPASVMVEVSYTSYDLDGDGKVDYIEWVVPHLSSQTYTLVISTQGYTGSVIKTNNYYRLPLSVSPPYDSLVSYWSFDTDLVNTATTTHYDYTGVHNGTGVGQAVVNSTYGRYGNGIHFDGNGDYVSTGININSSANPNITVCAWINFFDYSITSQDIVVDQSAAAAFDLRAYTATYILWDVFNSTGGRTQLVYSTRINDTAWHQVCGLRNTTTSMLYVDNVLRSSGNIMGGDSRDGVSLTNIGNSNPSSSLNGSIDEVMIFNSSLNSSQISAIYNNQSARFQSSATLNASQINVTSKYYNNVNVSSVFSNLMSTNISMLLGYYSSGWNYTSAQNLTSSGNVYNVNAVVTNFSENFTLYSDIYGFYTPLLNDSNIILNTTYDDILPTLAINKPLNTTYNNLTQTINLSSSEVGTGSLFANVNNSLIGWWRMDDLNSSGGVVDYMNRNNGTVNGNAAQTSAGKLGKGFSFDGSGDYLRLDNTNGNLKLNNSDATFSAWIKPNTIVSYDGIIGNNFQSGGWWFSLNAGKIAIWVATNGAVYSSNTAVSSGQWSHVLVTYSNLTKNASFYLNGIRDGSAITANIIGNGGTTFYIGEDGRDGVDYPFDGTIDDVLIFNRSLTSAEVLALYNATSPQYTYTYTSDGSKTITSYSQDLAGNVNSTVQNFTIDTVYPTINFTSPTPGNLTTQSSTSIYVNVTSNDSGQHYILADFDRSLVGWWTMDAVNSSGSPTDLSSYSNNGTKVGNAAQTDAGKFGKGFIFDGVTSYVQVIDSNNLDMPTNNFAFSFWFKTNGTSSGTYAGVFQKGANDDSSKGYFVNIGGTSLPGQLNIIFGNGTKRTQITSASSYNNNAWHNLVVVYNRTGNMSFYVDGAKYSTEADISGSSSIDISSSSNLLIGKRESNVYFNGSIDDVMIFNRSLSSSEIASLYNASASQYYNNFTGLADGTHTITGYAVDIAGNANQTEQRQVSVDTAVPFVGIISPLNQTYNTQSILVNITNNSDALGVWWNNGTSNLTYLSSLTYTFGEGSHILIAYANDSAGNVNSTNKTFFVDSIYPLISIIYPENNSILNRNNISVNYTASDTNINSCWWNVNSGANSTIACGTNITGQSWEEGWNNVSIWTNDTLNNVNSSNVIFFVDTVNPSVIFGKNVSQIEFSSGTIRVNWTAIDVNLNSTLFNVTYPNGSVLFSSIASSGSINMSSSSNLSVLGIYFANFWANDSAGNSNLTSSNFSVNDTTSPQLIITFPQNGSTYNYHNQSLNYTATDVNLQACWKSLNGEANITIPGCQNTTVNYGGAGTTEGQNNIIIYINDTSGNINSTNKTFFIDTTGPTISLITPADTFIFGASTVNFSFIPLDNAGISYCGLYGNWSGVWTVNESFANPVNNTLISTIKSIADGVYKWNIWCNDSLGNGAWQGNNRSFTVDTANPVVNIVSLTNNQYLNYNTSIDLNYAISTPNTQYCWYSVDGGSNATISGCQNITLNLSDGVHDVDVWINSTAGLEGHSMRNFTVDTIAPVASSILPEAGKIYSASSQIIDFVYNVSELNIKNCSLRVSAQTLNSSVSVDTGAGATNSFTNSLVAGDYVWNVVCYDLAENTGASGIMSLAVNSPAVPEVPASSSDSSSGGGGGGGGSGASAPSQASRVEVPGIVVDESEINSDLIINSNKERIIRITNNGNTSEHISIGQTSLEGFVSFDKNSFDLAPGQSQEVTVTLNGNDKVGVFAGRIFIAGKEVLVSLNVRSKALLFDSLIAVPDEFKVVRQGQKLSTQITLIPMGENPRLDVTLNYVIKDYNGKTLVTESETILVEGQKTFKKDFYTNNLPEGDYVVGLELIYPNGVATSSSHFAVRPAGINLPSIGLIVMILLVAFVSVLVLISIIRYKKHKRQILSR